MNSIISIKINGDRSLFCNIELYQLLFFLTLVRLYNCASDEYFKDLNNGYFIGDLIGLNFSVFHSL